MIETTYTRFGDMVPDKSFVVNKGTWLEYSKTAFSISYLIIGKNIPHHRLQYCLETVRGQKV